MKSPSGRPPTARSTAGLTGLAERIYDIAYSPDGKWMATASGDPGVFGVAKLWLAEPGGGGKPVRDLAETQDVVFAVAFSPDSKKIATAGADRTIRVFEVETGKLLDPDRGPRRLDLRRSPSAPTASGWPAPAATRPARSSTSRRKSRW